MAEKEKKFNLVSYVEGRLYEKFVRNNSDNAPIVIDDPKSGSWFNVLRWYQKEGLFDNFSVTCNSNGDCQLVVNGFKEKNIKYAGYCNAIKKRIMSELDNNVAREQEPNKEEFEQHVEDNAKKANVERCIIEKAKVA